MSRTGSRRAESRDTPSGRHAEVTSRHSDLRRPAAREPATGTVIQTLAIPRGQIAIASGHAESDAKRLVVKATRGETEYGICSTSFLDLAFRTDAYQLTVDFHNDGSWSYVSDTTLMVKGRDEPFLHRDRNTLTKIAEPDLNPWAKIARGGSRGG